MSRMVLLYCRCVKQCGRVFVPIRHCLGIDLFSLYFLFSHFRPRDVTLENSFFQMLSYAHAYVRITYDKTKENSLENIDLKWENETYKLKRSFTC